MSTVFIYSDMADLAAQLVAFTKETGNTAAVLAFDQQQAEKLENVGADVVYLLKGDAGLIENNAKGVSAFLQSKQADLFLVGATARGRDFAARVAGYADCAMVSDSSEIHYEAGKAILQRMLYGGAVTQTQELEGFGVITIGKGKFEPISGKASIEAADIDFDTRCKLLETTPVVKEGADLTSAERVVCIGMGMAKKEDMVLAEELATVMNAQVGCSRGVAEERKWLPIEKYLGISGNIIKPKIYLAMGVSGQIQHLVGVRESKNIVAINTNPKAPIFRAADYGVVGDLYEIVPLLIQALR